MNKDEFENMFDMFLLKYCLNNISYMAICYRRRDFKIRFFNTNIWLNMWMDIHNAYILSFIHSTSPKIYRFICPFNSNTYIRLIKNRMSLDVTKSTKNIIVTNNVENTIENLIKIVYPNYSSIADKYGLI